MVAIPFFLNTWEEYYTGELNLPIIHGVSEGTLVACTAMHITGFLGTPFWFNRINILGFDLQYNHVAVLACLFAGFFFALLCLTKVIIQFKEKRHDSVKNLFIFVLLVTSLMTVINFSNSWIVTHWPKFLIITYGLSFAKLVGHLQLAHLADAKFMQFRRSLLSSFFVLPIVSLLNYHKIIQVNIDYFIVFFFALHLIGKFFLISSICPLCLLLDRGAMRDP